ncbi:50S ribosomal protein L29 [Candidatus Woesearchaeota archaeon]|nr:50S ribosomal protein L29 [Candidatus Woesearchaeota archaeon]
MKIKELKSLSKTELEEKLAEIRKQLMKDNTQVSSGTTPKSPGLIKANKKTIAKILTILKQKQSEEKK